MPSTKTWMVQRETFMSSVVKSDRTPGYYWVERRLKIKEQSNETHKSVAVPETRMCNIYTYRGNDVDLGWMCNASTGAV
jgi:hypothetical protein